jgi:hypothetical protein
MSDGIYFKIAGWVDLDKIAKMCSMSRSTYPAILK